MFRSLLVLSILAGTAQAARVTTYTDRTAFMSAEGGRIDENVDLSTYRGGGVGDLDFYFAPATFGGLQFTTYGQVNTAGLESELNPFPAQPTYNIAKRGVDSNGDPVFGDDNFLGLTPAAIQSIDIQFGDQQFIESVSFWIVGGGSSSINDYEITLFDTNSDETFETFQAGGQQQSYAIFRGYSDLDGIAKIRIEVPYGEDGGKHGFSLSGFTRDAIQSAGGGGNFPLQSTFVVVPEPTGWILATVALVGAALMRCRRRAWRGDTSG